jgi:hypothetical protein
MNITYVVVVASLIIGLAASGIAILGWNRWSEFKRILAVRRWIKHFIYVHYGRVNDLTIDCSGDRESPIAAGFDGAVTGIRHLLSFGYAGGKVPCTFLSEKREAIEAQAPKVSTAVIVTTTGAKAKILPLNFLRVFCRENAGRASRPAR